MNTCSHECLFSLPRPGRAESAETRCKRSCQPSSALAASTVASGHGLEGRKIGKHSPTIKGGMGAEMSFALT